MTFWANVPSQTPRQTHSYLVHFWGQNLNLPESLEGIIVGLSEQSDRFSSLSKTSNYLHNHDGAKKINKKH